jgi:UDP-2-acetamido-2,6-beta-L-arabino-hexul-4-ose reductase
VKVLVTGADGFLGWHTRARLRSLTSHEVVGIDKDEWADLDTFVRNADAIIHMAGVNRGTDEEVESANIALARDVAEAMRASGGAPRIIYANSIQAGNGTPYGVGKGAAAGILAEAASQIGSHFVDVRLPNLFGEHGRPQYNSFVATFAHAVMNGQTPQIVDRPVDLLHVQGAAQAFIDALETDAHRIDPAGVPTTVQGVFDKLHGFNVLYATGDVPPLDSNLDVDLFNTLRAALFPTHYPIPLVQRTDARGSLVEVVRAHGGPGQTFVSTTKPGVTRGEHYHLRKVERFVVVGGSARISLRKVLTDSIISFDVTGDAPAIVDMPTMWVHNITNTGSGELTTLFWTHELFDPDAPDTFPEAVAQ